MGVQDIQFRENEPEAERVKKLRAMMDELQRLGRGTAISQLRQRITDLEAEVAEIRAQL